MSICFGISAFGFSQSVGIGTIVPNGSAQLDITSTSKGILIPRMNTAAITTISNPAKGLMVYDSSKNQLMVNMGTAAIPNWQTIVSKSGWNLMGNSGINPGTNFIGTSDVAPLIIKVNNVKSGYVDTGTNNTGIGFRTLFAITTGTDNVAVGYKALVGNSSGGANTGVGSNALLGNTTGSYNAASGIGSLAQNSTGNLNAAFGALSLNRNIMGNQNTASGTSALYWNTASNNTAVGFESLNHNTTGTGNSALGTSAMWNNDIGSGNTASGLNALYFNNLGNDNTAIGSYAAYHTKSYSNVAIGVGALYQNTDRSNLVAIGDSSLFNNGLGAGVFSPEAIYNTAIGSKALFSNTTGSQNTALGNQTLFANTWGIRNTALGSFSLFNTTGSDDNTSVGYAAGARYDMGYNNTMIGAASDVIAAGMYNCVGLGYIATCTASSQARIGNSSTISIGGYGDWTNFSDGRYKKNIQENVKGIEFIMKLHPVTYQLDVQGINNKLNESRGREMDAQSKQAIADKEKMIFSGFVAQEVEKAAKESGYDFSGVDAPKNENDFYGLRYGDFVVPLVKASQEQQVIINDLQKKVQLLEDQVKLLLQASTHKN